VDRDLARRLDILRGLCFCMLYDLCCWMARAHEGGVPTETVEYSLMDVGGLNDPLERLQKYVNAELLETWRVALQPFLGQGLTLQPELGDTGPLREVGLEARTEVTAEVRFHNRSVVVDDLQQRHPLPAREWLLEIRVSRDLTWVLDARLRAVEP
jgi:hypothetical protein